MVIFFVSHYVFYASHNCISEFSRYAPLISMVQCTYDCVNQHPMKVLNTHTHNIILIYHKFASYHIFIYSLLYYGYSHLVA